MNKAILTGIILVLMLVVLPSCAAGVSQEEYDRVSSELAAAQTEIQSLQHDLDEAREQVQSLQADNEAAPSVSLIEVEIGQSFEVDSFRFEPISMGIAERIITGPYSGGVYFLSEPKTGYKFVYLKVKVCNDGMERKEPPLYGRDGEFKVQVDRGYIYQDIASIASLGFGSERWAGEATEEDKSQYPILNSSAFDLNPEEEDELVKAFEILEDTEPIEFTFRLLGRVEMVIIKLQ